MNAGGSSGTVGRGSSQQRTCSKPDRASRPAVSSGRGEVPGREADELRRELAGDAIDRLADAGDVPLSPALDLEPSAVVQGPRQHRPQALVIAYPVQRGGGDDRVHLPVQPQLEHVTAEHLGPPAEPRPRQLDHLRRGVECQHPSLGDQVGQQLGDAPGAAADVEHGGVRGEALETLQDRRRPFELGLADAVVRTGVPGGRAILRAARGMPAVRPLRLAATHRPIVGGRRPRDTVCPP